MKKEPIQLTGETLTIEEVIKVAYKRAEISIADAIIDNALKSQEKIKEKGDAGKVIYGVTTGFGSNADKVIKSDEYIEVADSNGKKIKVRKLEQLQTNLLRSHACGVGDNFSEPIVRAIMVIRLNTLIKGFSGVQKKTIEVLMQFINKEVHPVIPQQGSVGSSGDLCPLSHMALPLIGEGYVTYKGQEMKSHDFFEKYAGSLGIEKVSLGYKEGLALNNGTTVMTAVGVMAIVQAEEILNVALVNSTLLYEALCAREDFYGYDKLHIVRRHTGQADIASAIKTIAQGSNYINLFAEEFKKLDKNNTIDSVSDEIIASQKLRDYDDDRKGTLKTFVKKKSKPQDSYSVRCSPQVFGASLHAIRHVRSVLKEELNAAVDNPLIFVEDDRVISGGNFHGQPIALVMDYLKLAVAEIGNIVERQINKLVDDATNDGLPPFLTNDGGLNSGLMIPQYAAASLVSENKVLVHPASADSIPTCANTEDHVSMGTIAARQALEITQNVRKIISIAILTAHHGFMLRGAQLKFWGLKGMKQAEKTNALYNKVKSIIPGLESEEALNLDRFVYDDLKSIQNNWSEFVSLAGNNLKME